MRRATGRMGPGAPFQLVPESQFTAEHLLLYPVWSELYDCEEREEIISWGVDPEWLDKQLEMHHHGDDHAVYPLLRTDPLPDRMRITFRARFETPLGNRLWGYVVNQDAYCIGVYLSGEEFILNRQIVDRSTRAAFDRLRRLLQAPNDPILPLRYETDFSGQDGRRIEGVFQFAGVTDSPPGR